MKYLELYKRWIETGHLTNMVTGDFANGLCYAFDYQNDALFDLFHPSDTDSEEYINYADMYWASETEDDLEDNGVFNGLRQNIVLFLAAMNGEL